MKPMPFIKLSFYGLFISQLFMSLAFAGGGKNCSTAQDIGIDKIEALSNLVLAKKVEMKKSKELDFKFNPESLINKGKVYYSSVLYNGEISDELKKIMKDMKIASFDPEKKFISFSKTAYFIPKAKATDFTPELTGSREYVEKTLAGISLEKPSQKGNIRTRKNIPIFDDAVTEWKPEFKVTDEKNGSAVASTKLVGTDEATKYMQQAQSQSFYQTVPSKGVIVTTYNFGVMDQNELGWKKVTAIKMANSTGKGESSFKNETMTMLEKNTEWFKK